VQRFGSTLNAHVHFHCCVIDGVFVAGADGQVQFAEAAALRPEDLAAVQQQVRRRVLRYCARPPFALERLEQLGEDALIYRFDQPQPDGRPQLRLTPLQLIERLAALIPPPRLHRHRYHGVLD
jgi:hypothetical protein